MREIDPRVEAARDEAARFARRLHLNSGWWFMILVGALSFMAHYDVGLKWIVVTGISGGTLLLSLMIIEVAQRLDLRCSYIEQCCTDIDRQAANPRLDSSGRLV